MGLLGVTRGYRGNKGLQGATGGLKGVTRGYRGLQEITVCYGG